MDLLDNPLVWPELECELAPFRKYFRGVALNAGSGSRSLKVGTRDLNLDVDPANHPQLIADLHNLPLRDQCIDTIVSVAVLEHTRRAWEVAGELFRVLRPGGHAIIAIPFLQPQHACPHDYVRFTEAGLVELMGSAGFEVVETKPVHHFGQTIAWLLWEYYKENPPRRRWRPVVGWCIRQLSRGRFFRGRCANAENTFYVVARRPGEWISDCETLPNHQDWFLPRLVCPQSRQSLQQGEGRLECSFSGKSYRWINGMVDFLETIN